MYYNKLGWFNRSQMIQIVDLLQFRDQTVHLQQLLMTGATVLDLFSVVLQGLTSAWCNHTSMFKTGWFVIEYHTKGCSLLHRVENNKERLYSALGRKCVFSLRGHDTIEERTNHMYCTFDFLFTSAAWLTRYKQALHMRQVVLHRKWHHSAKKNWTSSDTTARTNHMLSCGALH